MKKALGFIIIFILLIIAVFVYLYNDKIYMFVAKTINGNNEVVKLGKVNKYYRDYDFMFVKNTDNFKPKNKNDLYNIVYTVINSGRGEFTFYCDDSYESCINDVEELANDQSTLSDINNYVHPFNSFDHIETEYNTLGKITIMITKNYSFEDIKLINDKIDEVYDSLVLDNSSLNDNILRVHDYIINNTTYDSEFADNGSSEHKSSIAYGPLFEGYAICGGYTDLMQLFLERMNIKSYRVSSNEHVWNAVYYNNKWLNLDLTWDDPVSDDGKDYLNHDYFLITTTKLKEIEKTQHDIDFNHYPELKEA